ncbi:MAG: hypothetical protein NTX61_15910 [Bacteroidetes bacterium]|nr:hypothetical protein [Bacteroidota bacterium]
MSHKYRKKSGKVKEVIGHLTFVNWKKSKTKIKYQNTKVGWEGYWGG